MTRPLRAAAMRAVVVGALSSSSAACSLPQSPVCAAMLDCLDVTTFGCPEFSMEPVREAYDPGGTCWRDRESATACERACREQLEFECGAFPDVEVCCVDAGPGLYDG